MQTWALVHPCWCANFMLRGGLSVLRLSDDWLHGWLSTLGVVDTLLDPAALMESFQPSEPPVHLQAWTIALQFPQVSHRLGTVFALLDLTLCVHVPGLRFLRVFEEIHLQTCSSAPVPDASRVPLYLTLERALSLSFPELV